MKKYLYKQKCRYCSIEGTAFHNFPCERCKNSGQQETELTPLRDFEKNKLRVLIACEESQVVCTAFRELGHEAFSCDILPCSGGHPEWHIQDDVLKHLNDGWDLMIAHPPCTYLSRAGARWLHQGGKINPDRYANGLKAKEFFLTLLNANIPMIAIENPTPLKIYELPLKFCKETKLIPRSQCILYLNRKRY